MQHLKKSNCFIAFALLFIIVTGCSFIYSDDSGIKDIGTRNDAMIDITQEDMRTDKDISARSIDLSTYDENLLLGSGGDYYLSGEYHGTLYIDSNEYPVHLFLDNVNIISDNGNAIYIMSSSKVVITCLPETENIIKDSVKYEDGSEYACIFSESDITFNGDGELDVIGISDDAVHSKDIVRMVGANVCVKAKGSGIKGNDGVIIYTSNVNVEAEKNGIMTSKNDGDEKGNIYFEDSNVSIIAGKTGVLSANNLNIRSGKYFFKGVLGDMDVKGQSIIAPEALINE